MSPARQPRYLWAPLAALFFGVGCLPTDTRPEPGTLDVVTETEDATLSGTTTADGWGLSFDRMLVSVGHASAEGDECIAYNDPDYARVLNALRPGAQKVSTIFVSGFCEFDIELSSPKEDSALGSGVTSSDRDFLRTPGSDSYVPEGGISFYIVGQAEKAGVTKTFAWPYRNRIDYSTCGSLENGVFLQGVSVKKEQSKDARVTLHGTTAFQTQIEPRGAPLGFDAVAGADANGDDEVTLDELGDVRLADVQTSARYADADSGWVTLEDYVYHGLFPRVVRYEDEGVCELEVFPNDRVPR